MKEKKKKGELEGKKEERGRAQDGKAAAAESVWEELTREMNGIERKPWRAGEGGGREAGRARGGGITSLELKKKMKECQGSWDKEEGNGGRERRGKIQFIRQRFDEECKLEEKKGKWKPMKGKKYKRKI